MPRVATPPLVAQVGQQVGGPPGCLFTIGVGGHPVVVGHKSDAEVSRVNVDSRRVGSSVVRCHHAIAWERDGAGIQNGRCVAHGVADHVLTGEAPLLAGPLGHPLSLIHI